MDPDVMNFYDRAMWLFNMHQFTGSQFNVFPKICLHKADRPTRKKPVSFKAFDMTHSGAEFMTFRELTVVATAACRGMSSTGSRISRVKAVKLIIVYCQLVSAENQLLPIAQNTV